MTKSTFPDEWLQPLVKEKVTELNREAMKDFVTVEKKVYDALQKSNLDLMEKLEKATEALRFYADSDCYEDFGRFGLSEVDEDGGEWAQKVLDEIKDDGV